MLDYNEIKPRKVIIYEGNPFEILSSHVFRKQQRKPVNAVKMKNLLTGKVMETAFHQSDKVEVAEVSKKKIKYLYSRTGSSAGRSAEYWFCEEKNPGQRFQLDADIVTDQLKYVKQNSLVELISFGEQIVGLELPIKVDLKVIETAPAIKGNTVQGGLKQVTLETGLVVNTPMFINEGDLIRLNTETGEYVERVN